MADALIELTNITQCFDTLTVLKNLSLRIQRGETVGITGNSGRGKSTLLHICAGLIKPNSGSVRFSYQRPAYVFQDYRLLPWMTVLENVTLPIRRHLDARTVFEKAEQYLKAAGLGESIQRYPDELSGGMQQRVGIARALAAEPDVIFLDEPLSALDTEMRQKMTALILQYQQERNVALVCVSHQEDDLNALTERVIRL